MKRNLLRAVAAGVFVVSGITGSLPQTSSTLQTRFTIVLQENCPLKILRVAHTSLDDNTQVKLRNQTLKGITSYQIGWIVLIPQSAPSIALGKPVNVPGSGLKPGEVAETAARKIAAGRGATDVRFFIAAATWEQGGWKANLKEIEADALENKQGKPEGIMSNPGDSPG